MEIKADEISKIIREQIEGYRAGIDVSEVGTVISVGDGIARVYGLERVMAGELLDISARRDGTGAESGRESGRCRAARRIHGNSRRRPGEAHRPHHGSAGRRSADRPRGQCARAADRRQGPDRHRQSRFPSNASRRALSIANL